MNRNISAKKDLMASSMDSMKPVQTMHQPMLKAMRGWHVKETIAKKHVPAMVDQKIAVRAWVQIAIKKAVAGNF